MRARLLCFAAVAGCANQVTVDRDVSYGDSAADTLDVYRPDDGATGRPAVMIIHGGAWQIGDKTNHADHAERLAEAGYVAISIDYPLLPDAAYPQPMQDSSCALAFVRAQADAWGLDPARVAVMGYSAGGHLVSLLGVAFDEPDFACNGAAVAAPAAVISGAGPQDLRGWSDVQQVHDLLGGTVDERPARYDAASPITHARGDAPPFLFVHGTDDWFVPIQQSRDMRDALRAKGVDARLLELAGQGHLTGLAGDGGTEELGVINVDTPEAWLAIDDFLADTVGAP